MKFYILILLALIFASPLSLLAENPDGDFEVTVFSGWSFINVDRDDAVCTFCFGGIDPPLGEAFPSFFIRTRNEVGDSLLFGAKFGYFLNDRSEIEGTFAIAPNHDVRIEQTVVCPDGEICPLQTILLPDFFFNENLIAYHYEANFLYHLTESKTRPYLTFGIGGISSDVGNNTGDNLRTDLAFNFGGGVKFYFERLAFRLEVNDHVIPDYFFTGETEHDVQLQYGILFRLR